MARNSMGDIMKKIQRILEKEKELSIRKISLKTKTRWHTIEKALEVMKSLNLVKERKNKDTKRVERLFSLVK